MRADPEGVPASVALLPERRRLAGAPSPALARLMARAEPGDTAPGEQAQLGRWFRADPPGWPVAALQRQSEAGDAGAWLWLRADPVHVRAEMRGARLMAWGRLGLDAAEADALVACVAPAFEEAGMDIGRTAPERWYLRLPPDAPSPPAGAWPADALGEDLLAHLPTGEAGRTWRRLQSEAQILLTQHPVNLARAARGAPTANSLGFWGEGVHPAALSAAFGAGSVATRDPLLAALARAAGRVVVDDDDGRAAVLDLRPARRWEAVDAALATRLRALPPEGLVLDFADSPRLRCRPAPWWRRWA
jgi:hypothetical protein